MGRRRRRGRDDETPDDSIEVWGGEKWFVVDHTSGGAPIGIRLAELERDLVQGRRHYEPERVRARRLLRDAFFRETPEVGRPRRRGDGLSRSGWAASVERVTEPGEYIVLLPHSETGPDYASRVRTECRILADLSHRRGLAFRVPRPVALLTDGDDPVLIESVLYGSPATQPSVVGAVAAAVHRLEVDAEGPPTRRDVALATIAELERQETDEPPIRRALRFARRNLPGDGPSCFTHGDLLPQNILVSPLEDLPGIIDFERARRGDPAQELAIVTRGIRRPFGMADGAQSLLTAYLGAGGHPVTLRDIRFYEVLLLAGIVSRWSRSSGGESPDTSVLLSLLNRAQAGAG